MALYPDFLYVFTGHSLGAALATIAAHDMILAGFVPKAQTIMYNFGSPRVFNFPIAQSVVNTIPVIFRVARYKDVFVHLPPCSTNIFFRCTQGGSDDIEDAAFLQNNAIDMAVDNMQVQIDSSQEKENVDWNPIWHPWHIWQNIFYYEDGNSSAWKLCNGGEDYKCSDKYSPLSCNVNDHLVYMGVELGRCNRTSELWSNDTTQN